MRKNLPKKQPKRRGRRTAAGDFDPAGDFEPLEQQPTTQPHAKLWETLHRGRAEREMRIATGDPLTVEDAKYGADQRELRRKGAAKSRGRKGRYKKDPEVVRGRYKFVCNAHPNWSHSKICREVAVLENVSEVKVATDCKVYKRPR